MARIVFGDVTGGVNFGNFDVSALLDYDHYSTSKTSVKVFDDKQNYFQVAGQDLHVSTSHHQLADVTGTIKFATWKIDGHSAFSATGLHADAHDLFVAAKSGNVVAFANLVLGGNDTIVGTSFGDTLWGGDGQDRLLGGKGADDLFGNSGADTFSFAKVSDSTNAANGQDTIHDFTSGDKIQLTQIDANAHQSGNNTFKFMETDAFDGSTKHGELRYETTGSDTYVYGDTDGDGEANFTIHLTGNVTLDKGDFNL